MDQWARLLSRDASSEGRFEILRAMRFRYNVLALKFGCNPEVADTCVTSADEVGRKENRPLAVERPRKDRSSGPMAQAGTRPGRDSTTSCALLARIVTPPFRVGPSFSRQHSADYAPAGVLPTEFREDCAGGYRALHGRIRMPSRAKVNPGWSRSKAPRCSRVQPATNFPPRQLWQEQWVRMHCAISVSCQKATAC